MRIFILTLGAKKMAENKVKVFNKLGPNIHGKMVGLSFPKQQLLCGGPRKEQ